MNKFQSAYCPSPEIGINIDAQGFIRACCASTKFPIAHMDEELDWNNFYESEMWIKIKQEIQSGNSEKFCKSCHTKEQLGLASRRISLINTYSNLSLPEDYTYLDIDMGNVCNLWCPQCESKYSSKWYSIDKDGSMHNSVQRKVYSPFILSKQHIDNVIGKIYKNITRCQLKGGEPFASKNFEYFLEFLQNKNCQQLDIITNGTILSDKQFELLKSFKKINVSVSVDGVDEIGNWIRYNKVSDWSVVENNIKKFMTIPNATGDFLVCTMVYNFFEFDKLLEKMDNMIGDNPNWKIVPKQIVQKPDVLNVNKIVPYDLRMNMINKVRKFQNNKKIKFFDYWISYISRPDEVDQRLLTQFHEYTKKINKLKSTDVYNFLPVELQCTS